MAPVLIFYRLSRTSTHMFETPKPFEVTHWACKPWASQYPGIQERVFLGLSMAQEGRSQEEIHRAINPRPSPPIMTGECRASATAAIGTNISACISANEKAGMSGQASIPMMAAGARAAATCGFKFSVPASKNLPAAPGVAVGIGVVSVEISQTSTWPELYISVGPGFVPELKIPATPSFSAPLF